MATKSVAKRDAVFDLAGHVACTRYEDLAAEDGEIVKKSILDTLGTIIAGSSEPPFAQLVSYFTDLGGKGESTVIVHGGRIPAQNAVLLNAGMARALDLDDIHEQFPSHPSVSMVPAGLAMAERQGGKNGKELITAVALGQDVMLRILAACKTWPVRQGRQSCHLGGTFGAAAVVGKLLGLDTDNMVNALGNAYCLMTSDRECLIEGALSQRVHQGIAASGGVFAAILAQIGITGSKNVLEGKCGYYPVFEHGQYYPEALTAELGKRFLGTGVSLKPFPSCRITHAGMVATLELVTEYDIKPEHVEEIRVHCSQGAIDLLFGPHRVNPQSAVDSHFSFPWCLGTIVVKRKAWIDDFTVEGVQKSREAVLPIAYKVKAVRDLELESMEGKTDSLPSVVEIKTTDGRTLSRRVEYVKGHPRNPMSWEELATKFRNCTPFAARPLRAQNIEKVIELVHHLEQVDDVTEIVRLLS